MIGLRDYDYVGWQIWWEEDVRKKERCNDGRYDKIGKNKKCWRRWGVGDREEQVLQSTVWRIFAISDYSYNNTNIISLSTLIVKTLMDCSRLERTVNISTILAYGFGLVCQCICKLLWLKIQESSWSLSWSWDRACIHMCIDNSQDFLVEKIIE